MNPCGCPAQLEEAFGIAFRTQARGFNPRILTKRKEIRSGKVSLFTSLPLCPLQGEPLSTSVEWGTTGGEVLDDIGNLPILHDLAEAF